MDKYDKMDAKQKNAEDIIASRKSGDTDDPIDVYLYDPIAIRLTHGFIRAGWSANAVTIASLITGVAGSFFFFSQSRWINLIGIFLELLAYTLDCCDGQVARLTGSGSELGRVLDGLVDSLNYTAIYLVLGFRMMGEKIPFSDVTWSFWIWFLVLAAGFCHSSQARMADYYRGLHLYFLKGRDRTALARSRDLKAEIASLPEDTPLYGRIYRKMYLAYTLNQERHTPKAQRLLKALERKEGEPPGPLTISYLHQSRQHIQMTNYLAFNIRSFVLFAMILLRIHAFFFIFGFLALEGVKIVMVSRYEEIAEKLYRDYF